MVLTVPPFGPPTPPAFLSWFLCPPPPSVLAIAFLCTVNAIMRVFVLVAVRCGDGCVTTHPPSVWHLQESVRARSPSCYHATSGGYLWTRDALFRTLRRTHEVKAPESGLENEGAAQGARSPAPPCFYFFSALLDVGNNEEDVGLVAMLLMQLCVAWPDPIAAHMEVCRVCRSDLPCARTVSLLTAPLVDAETDDPSWQLQHLTREEELLVLLADEIEATAATQEAFLARWGVHNAWDYTRALQGRSWWVSGGMVAVLPSQATTKVVESVLMLELSRMVKARPPLPRCSENCRDLSETFEEALAHGILEKELTHSMKAYLRNEVEQRIESRALHQMTVVMPPAMALFLRSAPSSVLHDCLLYHTTDCPLFAMESGRCEVAQRSGHRVSPLVVPGTSPTAFVCPTKASLSSDDVVEWQCRVADDETSRLTDLFREYDLLLSGDGYVRVPLAPVSRYVFTQLLCQSELPSALMRPFMRQHSLVTRPACERNCRADSGATSRRSSPPTEEEIVLGIKVTWAVERWRTALRRGSEAVPPIRLPMWNEEPSLWKDELCRWVQKGMRNAQREVAELYSVEEGVDTCPTFREEECVAGTVSSLQIASSDTASPLQRCRGAALEQLERKLFAPFSSSYRGSSTEWLGHALRDMAREQVDVASNMALHEHVGASLAGPAPAACGAASANFLCSSASDSCSNATSEDGTESAGTLLKQEAEGLLAQLAELEVVLQDEVANKTTIPLARASDSQITDSGHSVATALTSDQETEVMPWLTAADIQEVTRSEVFLNHIQLLQSEMEQDP
ncbi:hypothetical protein, conserved [Leishmania tarentolae]|uniref:Uncharacterized protein n=1 Tax=Leishmania tarentolae TaxID=5689 RepID=A0A640KNJ3_LEITA|nr:hypothetical protein, conserved [Leishmania tarentolae]